MLLSLHDSRTLSSKNILEAGMDKIELSKVSVKSKLRQAVIGPCVQNCSVTDEQSTKPD